MLCGEGLYSNCGEFQSLGPDIVQMLCKYVVCDGMNFIQNVCCIHVDVQRITRMDYSIGLWHNGQRVTLCISNCLSCEFDTRLVQDSQRNNLFLPLNAGTSLFRICAEMAVALYAPDPTL